MKKVLKKPPSSRPQPASTETTNRLRYFAERKDAITETIRQLVEIESPSDNKPAVDQLGALLAGRFEKIGGHAKFHRVPDCGDHLQVDFPRQRQARALAGSHRHRVPDGNALDHAVPRGRGTALGTGRARYEVRHCAHPACARGAARLAQRQPAAAGHGASGFGRGGGQRVFPPHHRKPGPEIRSCAGAGTFLRNQGGGKDRAQGGRRILHQSHGEGSPLRPGFRKGRERDCRDGKANYRHLEARRPEARPHLERGPGLRRHAGRTWFPRRPPLLSMCEWRA